MRVRHRQFLGWSRARQRDERGATFVLTAICMVLLLWAGAFGVDLGFTVDGGRQAQAMADTAALDMARYVNIADAQVTQTAAENWLVTNKLSYVDTDNAAHATLTVVPGLWNSTTSTWSVPAACATGLPPLPLCNAVKVTATQTVPQIFGGGNHTVTRSSIATVAPEGGFSVGSYLASINTTQSPILNALLGTLGSANVTAVGFQGLADESVTLNQLITASGTILSPSNIMTQSLQASDWLSYISTAVANQAQPLNCSATPEPIACVAETALSSLSFNPSPTTSVALCQLVTVAISSSQKTSCSNGSLPSSALSASISVLQLLTTEAEIANGTNAISVGSLGGITGVVSGNLYLTVGQIPQIAFGPAGTKAVTAQVNADLQLNILGSGLLDIQTTGASATGTLSLVTCQNNTLKKMTVSTAGSGITNNVTLAGTNIGTVTANSYSLAASFTTVPPNPTTVAAGSNPFTAGSSNPSLTYAPAAGDGADALIVNPVTAVLGSILQPLGVSVGGAQTAGLSASCGSIELVK